MFAFQEDRHLIHPESSQSTILRLVDFAELGLPVLRQHQLGHLDNRSCYTVGPAEAITPPEGMVLEGLRQVYGQIDEDQFSVAGRALQIID